MRLLLGALAFAAAFVLFLLGVRAIRRRRGAFLLAVSAALAAITGAPAHGSPAVRRQDDVDARAKEVEKTASWKKMRKFFRKVADYLESGRDLKEDLLKEAEELRAGTSRPDLKEAQPADAPLLTSEEALGELAAFLGTAAYHVYREQGEGKFSTCYKRMLPVANPNLAGQRDLLKKQLDEGKITKEVYDRVLKVFDEVGSMNSLLPRLNARNTALVFRLIRDLAGRRAIDIPKIGPDVEKKIADLIEELGAEEIEKRDAAQAAILAIGEGAIPQLRKALEHKDSEVRARAQAILDELE